MHSLHSYTVTTATAHDNASVVTGLSAVLGITLFGVTLAVCILLISLVKRKLHESSHRTRTQGIYVHVMLLSSFFFPQKYAVSIPT